MRSTPCRKGLVSHFLSCWTPVQKSGADATVTRTNAAAQRADKLPGCRQASPVNLISGLDRPMIPLPFRSTTQFSHEKDFKANRIPSPRLPQPCSSFFSMTARKYRCLPVRNIWANRHIALPRANL